MQASDIDKTALLRIIYQGYERTNVEYKRGMAWKGGARYKLIKAVMALSNCGGGNIVIGVEDTAQQGQDRFTGVTLDDLATWEPTKVNRDINNYCQPPLDIDVIPVLDDDNAVTFVVLRIPGHGTVPHICTKDKQDSNNSLLLRQRALYYRSRNKECIENPEAADWPGLINRCTLARREELLGDFRQILTGEAPVATAKPERHLDWAAEMSNFGSTAREYYPAETKEMVFREILCYPVSDRTNNDIEAVKKALSEACFDYRGWPFAFYMPHTKVPPRFGDNTVYAYSNEPFCERPTFDFWMFDYGRGLFYAQGFTDESRIGQPLVIDPSLQAPIIAEAVIALGRIYDHLGVGLDQELGLALRYSPVKGARIASVDQSDYRIHASEKYGDSAVSLCVRDHLSRFLGAAPRLGAEITTTLARKMGYEYDLRVALEKTATDHLAKGQKVNQPIR